MFGRKLGNRSNNRNDRLQCRPVLMALEERAVPAGFVVTNTANAGPGSFRQAIIDANNLPGADTITFAAGVTGTIQIGTLGRLAVTDQVSIVGPGSSALTISGVSLTFTSAIMSTTAPTTISGLRFNAGAVTVSGEDRSGGAILSKSTLTLQDCIFEGNSATYSASPPTTSAGNGGAIAQSGGLLTVQRCQFLGNVAQWAFPGESAGGAIYATSNVEIHDSFFDNNQGVHGGAVYVSNGTLTVDGTTFQDNKGDSTYGLGGAIQADVITARNCTFVGNFSNRGGALKIGTSALIQNCTITNNSAYNGNPMGLYGGYGGGIYGNATIESTILSGNTNVYAPDAFGTITAKNSAIGSPNGVTLIDQGGNLPYGTDLKLGSIANNGGLTPTVALLANSPCINAGSNPAGLLTEQRGTGYPRSVGKSTDLGAFEVQGLPAAITNVQINDGSAQRSMVTSLKVTFDRTVTLPSNPADAFQLLRASDNALVMLSASQNGPAVTLTFTGGATDFASLADGRYTLTAFASMINGGVFDGNGDGTPGDDYTLASSGTSGVFRLFGDINGDGTVSASDFILFRESFGGINAAFDFDGDGSVSANDFVQFRLRFGGTLP
jgi:hypothetical protein